MLLLPPPQIHMVLNTSSPRAPETIGAPSPLLLIETHYARALRIPKNI